MTGIPTVSADQVPDPLPDGLFVVDVREPMEWERGRIDGSVHIPMSEFVERIGEIPADQQVLVVCKVGSRSAQATGFLQANGRDAVNLAGGMMAWERQGRPMVADDGSTPVVA